MNKCETCRWFRPRFGVDALSRCINPARFGVDAQGVVYAPVVPWQGDGTCKDHEKLVRDEG